MPGVYKMRLALVNLPDILMKMNCTPILVVGEPDDTDSADPESPGLTTVSQHPTDPACGRSSRCFDFAGAAR
jgi:hypothetical protein